MMPLPGISSPVSDWSPRGSSRGSTSSKCERPSRPVKRRMIAIVGLLYAHVADEALGRVLAPLAHQRLFGRQQIRAAARVQPVGVGPPLVHAPPRVGPVVVDLAAEQVTSHAPHVLVLAEPHQVLVVLEHGVGDLRSRISWPARRSGSVPVFIGCSGTGIAGSGWIPYTTSI